MASEGQGSLRHQTNFRRCRFASVGYRFRDGRGIWSLGSGTDFSFEPVDMARIFLVEGCAEHFLCGTDFEFLGVARIFPRPQGVRFYAGETT